MAAKDSMKNVEELFKSKKRVMLSPLKILQKSLTSSRPLLRQKKYINLQRMPK